MNPPTLYEADKIFRALAESGSRHPSVQIIVCAPFVYLEELSVTAKMRGFDVLLGAQDVFWETHGPFTGEISVNMLKNIGISHVLVGHSERRALGETDDMVNRKVKALLNADIKPVILVGEPEFSEARSDYLVDQLTQALSGVPVAYLPKLVLGYEPVWAISTNPGGRAASAQDAVEGIRAMKSIVMRLYQISAEECPPFIYGGSVDKSNIKSFLVNSDITGAVVGGASLRPEEFENMVGLIGKL